MKRAAVIVLGAALAACGAKLPTATPKMLKAAATKADPAPALGPAAMPAPAAPPETAAAPRPAPADRPALPANWSGMQWLYGSGEGAAASRQTYRAFTRFALAATRQRPRDGQVLADPAELSASGFLPCGDKPLAVVLDADETMIQNLGYEYALARRGQTANSPLIKAWQGAPRAEVAAMPGAVEALAALRKAGITVIANSNRDSGDAAALAGTLRNAGLGAFVHKQTLFLRGDVDGARGKDGRRRWIGDHYCVVAMAGDTLADFADGFNANGARVLGRRALAERFSERWGNGWFLLSNPVYGNQIEGGIDEVFAPAARWDEGE